MIQTTYTHQFVDDHITSLDSPLLKNNYQLFSIKLFFFCLFEDAIFKKNFLHISRQKC